MSTEQPNSNFKTAVHVFLAFITLLFLYMLAFMGMFGEDMCRAVGGYG